MLVAESARTAAIRGYSASGYRCISVKKTEDTGRRHSSAALFSLYPKISPKLRSFSNPSITRAVVQIAGTQGTERMAHLREALHFALHPRGTGSGTHSWLSIGLAPGLIHPGKAAANSENLAEVPVLRLAVSASASVHSRRSVDRLGWVAGRRQLA